jgi:hypothetical protein
LNVIESVGSIIPSSVSRLNGLSVVRFPFLGLSV